MGDGNVAGQSPGCRACAGTTCRDDVQAGRPKKWDGRDSKTGTGNGTEYLSVVVVLVNIVPHLFIVISVVLPRSAFWPLLARLHQKSTNLKSPGRPADQDRAPLRFSTSIKTASSMVSYIASSKRRAIKGRVCLIPLLFMAWPGTYSQGKERSFQDCSRG